MTKSIRQIIADTARHFHVAEKDIRGPSQEADLVLPRYVAMYLARRTGASYPRIGREFGFRHHTTVMHGVRTIGQRLATDAELTATVNLLIESPPASHFKDREVLSARFRDLERTLMLTQRAIGSMNVAVAQIRGQLEERQGL